MMISNWRPYSTGHWCSFYFWSFWLNFRTNCYIFGFLGWIFERIVIFLVFWAEFSNELFYFWPFGLNFWTNCSIFGLFGWIFERIVPFFGLLGWIFERIVIFLVFWAEFSNELFYFWSLGLNFRTKCYIFGLLGWIFERIVLCLVFWLNFSRGFFSSFFVKKWKKNLRIFWRNLNFRRFPFCVCVFDCCDHRNERNN